LFRLLKAIFMSSAHLRPDDFVRPALGHSPEATRAVNTIRGRLATGEKPPANLQGRVDAILKAAEVQ
jgi:hypothetical protein